MQPRELIEPIHLRPIVATFAGEWGMEPARLTFVRYFFNLVYRYEIGGMVRYLRITPGAHRSAVQIQSEIAFVRFLSESGLQVSLPVVSRGGELLHVAEQEGAHYLATVFEEAPGDEFTSAFGNGEPPDTFFREVGSVMGALHRATCAFERPTGFERFHWVSEPWSTFHHHVPESEREAWTQYRESMEWTATLSLDGRAYGMVHGDFAIQNLRIAPTGITLFDFDACCDHWFAYEIAIFLHYFGILPEKQRRRIYDALLDGYAATHRVDRDLLAQIPRFNKMRLLYSFLIYAREWGFSDLNANQQAYFEHRRRAFEAPSAWEFR